MGRTHKKKKVNKSRVKSNIISNKGEINNYKDLNEEFQDCNNKENNNRHTAKVSFIKKIIIFLKEVIDKKQVASSLLCTLITASIIKVGSMKTFIEYMLSALFSNPHELLDNSKIPSSGINSYQIIVNYYPIIFKTTTYLLIILTLYIIYKLMPNLLKKYYKYIDSNIPFTLKFSIAPFVLLATHFLPIVLYAYLGNYLWYHNIIREFKGILVILYISMLLYIELLILDLNKELSIKHDKTIYSSLSKVNFVIVLYSGIISMITFIVSLVIVSFNTNRSIVAITYGLSSTIGYLLYYCWCLIYRIVYIKGYSIKEKANCPKTIKKIPKLSIVFYYLVSILSVIGFIIFMLKYGS